MVSIAGKISICRQELSEDIEEEIQAGERVVISGVSGIYSNAHHVKDLADILYNKVNPVTPDNSRWVFNHSEMTRYTGKVPGLNYFDAQFFKVYYHLGNSMDVMSRKFLEQTYMAIIDAGINPEQLNGKKVGVYIGSSGSENEKLAIYAKRFYAKFGMAITGLLQLSKDGKTKSFDENADGSVKSEANNILFLQKAKVALRIYAEVVNVKSEYLSLLQDESGPRYGLYRNPSDTVNFFKQFYEESNVSPQDVQYVEAIPETDKAELEAYENFFCGDRNTSILVGSIMSNIGNVEGASGIAAITKDPSRYKSLIPHLVLVSGRQESSVLKILNDLKSRPVDPEELALLNNAHAARISGHLGRGFTILGVNENNKTVSMSEKIAYIDYAKRPLWFVYSGMGSQYNGMGTDLMRIPVFAAAIERCHRVLQPKGVDIVHIINSPDKSIFDNILNSFVDIAAIKIGLTDVLRELGVVPDKIIGHSVGELSCAYADECFTAEEMILSAYSRDLVSIQIRFIHGSMAAVGLGYQQILPMCPPEIEIACHNSSQSCTICGPSDIIQKFVASLVEKGIFTKEVPCSNIAYHSRYIADAGPHLLKYLSEVIKTPKKRSKRWITTSVPMHKWNEPSAKYSSPEYHTNNVLNSVLFEDVISLIPSNAILVEIAPHGLLQSILKRSLPETCTNIPLTRRGNHDNAIFLLEAIGKPVPLYMSASKKTVSATRYTISVHDKEHKYLQGHVIDGKPSLKYLIKYIIKPTEYSQANFV